MTASTLRYLVMAATFTYKINTDVEVLVKKIRSYKSLVFTFKRLHLTARRKITSIENDHVVRHGIVPLS